ncbi:MAG TPA: glycosyltransferase [Hyphomicrobiaceae bacterium]|nr:glycosyltransferase [Hyphomicrobiaceae bacterium]
MGNADVSPAGSGLTGGQGDAFPRPVKVVVALCTAQRPRMLESCLASLVAQRIGAGVDLTIAVVENHATQSCRPIVERFAAQPGAPSFVYASEPRIGIPIARNRSLDLALAAGADWIAFIDDDEVAEADWIASLLAAAQSLNADVVRGPVVQVNAATGAIVRDRKSRPTGARLKTAMTNNTLMRAAIAGAGGLRLRFDEGLRLTGGSDVEYFSRAHGRGATICWVNEAVVRESVPAERLSLSWRCARERRVGSNGSLSYIRKHGRPLAFAICSAKCLVRASGASLKLVLGVLIYPFQPVRGTATIFQACADYWRCAGSLGTFFGQVPEPYRVVEGY